MAITIKFDSIDELNGFIASAIGGASVAGPFNHFDPYDGKAPAAPVPAFDDSSFPHHTDHADGAQLINSDNVGVLSEGDTVSWVGAKFQFIGAVERVDGSYTGDDDDKVVFIRRQDTGKLVSLTNDDIDRYTLIKLAA